MSGKITTRQARDALLPKTLKRIRPSTGITITPSTINATEFGGAQSEYETEYVNFDITFSASDYENPKATARGKIPTDTTWSITANDDGTGYIKFEKTTETVTSGTNTLTFTVTVSEWDDSKPQTVTATITGVDGNGYDFDTES